MFVPRWHLGVWALILVASASPPVVPEALAQTLEAPRSLVLLTPREAVVHPVYRLPRDFAPGLREHRAAAVAITYRGPNPWIAAPIGLAWLITLDSAVKEWSQTGWQGEVGHDIARLGDKLGEGEIMFFVAGGSLFVGAFGGTSGLERASAVIAGMLAGPINNAVLKFITGRTRPNSTNDPLEWRPFSGGKSFPSGHVSVPFSIAGALDAATGNPVVAYPFYLAGALTGFARIYDNVHWFSDVVASAVIASIVSRKATHAVLDAWGQEPGLGKSGDGRDPGDARLRYQRPTGVHASLIATGTTLGVNLTF